MELSFKRLGLLIKKQFVENRKFYLFGTLAMMGVMGFVFAFTVSDGNFRLGNQGVFLGIGMVSFGCLFTLTLFSKLDKKEKRIQMMMLPSTAMEKLICAIIYGAVLFPIVYLVTIYPVLRFANYVDNNIMGYVNEPYVFNVEGMQVTFLIIFYIMQTVVLMFSVFIRQYKVPVAASILSLLVFGIIYFYPKVMMQFLPHQFNKEIKTNQPSLGINNSSANKNPVKVTHTFNQMQVIPFGNVMYGSGSAISLRLNLPRYQQGVFGMLLLLSIPFMWIITLFRLKESELS